MNFLSYSDDNGRSSEIMLWYKDAGTAGGICGRYRSQRHTSVMQHGLSDTHTTRAEFRSAMRLAAASLDNPGYNQCLFLCKAATSGTKDSCLFLSLGQIFGTHKNIDAAFIEVKHTYQFHRVNATDYVLRAKQCCCGEVYHQAHQSLDSESYAQPTYSSRAQAEVGKWCDAPAVL